MRKRLGIIFLILVTGCTQTQLVEKPDTMQDMIDMQILVLGMDKYTVMRVAGQPDILSDESEGIEGWYYEKILMRPYVEPIEHIMLVFANGRLAIIRRVDGPPPYEEIEE